MTKTRKNQTSRHHSTRNLRVILHRLAPSVLARYTTKRLSITIQNIDPPTLTNTSQNFAHPVSLSDNLRQSPLLQTPLRQTTPPPLIPERIIVPIRQQLRPLRLVRTCESALNTTSQSIEDICTQTFHTLGLLNKSCPHCGALFFEFNRRNRGNKILLCCHDGKVKIPVLSNPPD